MGVLSTYILKLYYTAMFRFAMLTLALSLFTTCTAFPSDHGSRAEDEWLERATDAPSRHTETNLAAVREWHCCCCKKDETSTSYQPKARAFIIEGRGPLWGSK